MLRSVSLLLFLPLTLHAQQQQVPQPPSQHVIRLPMPVNAGNAMCTWCCLDALATHNGWIQLGAMAQPGGGASLPDARRFLESRGLQRGKDFTYLEIPAKDFRSRDYELFRWVCADGNGCMVRLKPGTGREYHCVCVVGASVDQVWTMDPNQPAVVMPLRWEDFDRVFDGGVIVVRRKK